MTCTLRVRRLLRDMGGCALVLALGASGAAAQAPWPSEGPPRPLTAREVPFPPYSLQTLPNGLQVVVVLHHEQPVVSMRMIVRAGGALDPKGKHGLAQLVASLLTQGAGGKSAGELNDTIDFVGGEMGAGAGTDLSFINMVVMKDSLGLGLSMLSDLARRPTFAPAEIERRRQQVLSSLKVSFEDPEFIANSVFDRLVYGLHPYGMPQTGTPESIAAIARDDIVAFHQRNFVPNNTIMAIVGDLTAEEAFEGVKRAFGDWERRAVPADTFTAPPEPTRRVIVVNRPDAVQTEVRVGHIGIRRNHPDYMALNLAIRILGGEGANRLHQILRTARGLTYGAQADMDTRRESGAIEASTNTRSGATGEVLRLMVDEFWRLQRERVSERELSDAKAYLAGSFPLTIETPDAIATQILNVLFYGLPIEELQSFRQRVNAVTPDDIERVARFYLRPDRLSIVLVGNASTFTPQLPRVGFGTFEAIEAANLDLTAVDFKRAPRAGRAGGAGQVVAQNVRRSVGASYQQRGAIAPEDGPGARTLLDKVITAKGGLETLRAVQSITAMTREDMSTQEGKISVETTTHLQYPNRVHVETKLPDALIVRVFDGKRAWVKDPRGTFEVPQVMIRELELGFRRDTVSVLLAAHDGTVRSRLLPDVKDETGKLHHALELSATDLDPIVLHIDPATSLIAKQMYVVGGPGQPLVEELFSDYRPVDAVQIAFLAQVRRGGQLILERRITSIKINAPLDAALFKRPAS
jgi:zinc protease